MSIKLAYPTLKLPKKPKEPLWNIDIAACGEDKEFKINKITKKKKDSKKDIKLKINKIFKNSEK